MWNLLVLISVLLLNQNLQLHHVSLMDQAVRSRNTKKRKGKEKGKKKDNTSQQRKSNSEINYLEQYLEGLLKGNLANRTKVKKC